MQNKNDAAGLSRQSPAAEAEMSASESRYRQIVDDLATPQECAQLVEFADRSLILGDGYGGDANPHTETESFYGYTFSGAPESSVSAEHLLALRIIQRSRQAVMRHYSLRFLWLDYAHLVMREPIAGEESTSSNELSHPWHFDNQADHVKHRTHTAILYLNDGFEGGLTQFKEASFGPFRQVTPGTGKMISFAVDGNAHAVSKVLSGKRYVLNMWFSTQWKIWRRQRRILRPLK
jgi:hypothetical protein